MTIHRDERGRRRVKVHPAAPPKATLPEIQIVCGYITNDSYIASYFGVPLERVKQARAGMAGPNVKNRPSVTMSDDLMVDQRVHLDASSAAKRGSDRLLLRQLQVGQHWLDEARFKEQAKQFGYCL